MTEILLHDFLQSMSIGAVRRQAGSKGMPDPRLPVSDISSGRRRKGDVGWREFSRTAAKRRALPFQTIPFPVASIRKDV